MLELTPQRQPLEGGSDGSASWLRHERMTVAMTLAEKLHHTSRGQKLARVGEEVVHDAHDALRGQKTPPPGCGPAVSLTRGRRGATAPCGAPQGKFLSLLCWCSLVAMALTAQRSPFLVRRAVEDRKREEEKKEKEKARKKEAQEKADLELAKRDPWWAQHLADMKAMEERRNKFPYSASSSSKRKRKKRRKRRTPRTSSLPGRARRR